MHRALVVLLAFASLAPACAFAPPGEYALYRAYRYGASGAERVAAARRYVATYPEGPHATELTAELQTADSAAHADARDSAVAAAHDDPRMHPRELLLRWLGVAFALRAWNQPISQFYADNPGFVETFDAAPTPSCRPGGCVKTLVAWCPRAETYDRQAPTHAPMTFRLLARGSIIVGVDVALRRDGFALWHDCDRGLDALGGQPERWAVGQLRDAVLAAFPTAQSTPDRLSGAALDTHDPGAIDSAPGSVRWSFIVRCDARACLRVDGYDDTARGGEGGVRLWSIPAVTVAALGIDPTPLPQVDVRASRGVTTFAPIAVAPEPPAREHAREIARERARLEEGPPGYPMASVTVVSTGEPVDIAFIPVGRGNEPYERAGWGCRTRCEMHIAEGRYLIEAQSSGGRIHPRVFLVAGPQSYRVTPQQRAPGGAALSVSGTLLAVGGLIEVVYATTRPSSYSYAGSDSTAWVVLGVVSALGGFAMLAAGASVSYGARGRIERAWVRPLEARRGPEFVTAGVAPVEGGGAIAAALVRF